MGQRRDRLDKRIDKQIVTRKKNSLDKLIDKFFTGKDKLGDSGRANRRGKQRSPDVDKSKPRN